MGLDLDDPRLLLRKDVLDGVTYTGCARLDGPAIAAELVRMSGGESA